MSEDEKGFLARWSQRKRDAGKLDVDVEKRDAAAQEAEAAPPGDAEPPFDLASLPKLEDLTADTDMSVFFRKGVPDSIRNAALRKSWALDPAIRNYVNPALDYAYDWNTPGGVPGAGELAPGTDIARMVSQVMGMGDASAPAVQKAVDAEGDAGSGEVASEEAAGYVPAPDAQAPSVRLSDTGEDADRRGTAADDESDRPQDALGSFASQQNSRRHGSARPK
ncbi:DUF3306 domain-containing protein [Bradyrhizobium sp. LHD-71]|uniref:DUF3306 domain-containing protein n=1 Tax=Bradyrhizobium sp. LHD-71 TaxID=3072141 RepID=UPI0028109017|nr:DUF3306 domain-containing protein [Bradyrhizobium sp. LHD-71]MDQ8731438.1 DUF3306 domain-containing protein [Bradyrhizobium sp. LHD-71]